ncbi:MAG TPA: radical SAM family heme chaperone HemW [Flavobacteriales bacterium]|nr:radical SAM family heme chaperone HemW [Flavobacteriales bacterium]
MAGIYIHIPFCKQACTYCNFHFSTSLKHKDSLVNAILKEIKLRQPGWENEVFDTVYFGGGTPSILPVEDITLILDSLYKYFKINQSPEITLEANPDDLTPEKLQGYRDLGINRLSIGIQSFRQSDLVKLNRSHTAEQAEDAIKNAQNKGFDNITIDLIYGIPDLSNEDWQKNIQKVLDFNIPHVSAYALTVEPQTALAWQIKKGQFPKVSDDQAATQFDILKRTLTTNGFDHYEISNFGKPGFWSKHNTLYWQNIPYIGLGPGAHSFKDTQRRWNVANNMGYIKGINNAGIYFETENLSPTDLFNEFIMTGLRTSSGVDLDKIANLGDYYTTYLQKESKKYLEKNQLIIENNQLKAQPDYLFVIEGIIADLFIV